MDFTTNQTIANKLKSPLLMNLSVHEYFTNIGESYHRTMKVQDILTAADLNIPLIKNVSDYEKDALKMHTLMSISELKKHLWLFWKTKRVVIVLPIHSSYF